jgi:hypothetical protein
MELGGSTDERAEHESLRGSPIDTRYAHARTTPPVRNRAWNREPAQHAYAFNGEGESARLPSRLQRHCAAHPRRHTQEATRM